MQILNAKLGDRLSALSAWVGFQLESIHWKLSSLGKLHGFGTFFKPIAEFI